MSKHHKGRNKRKIYYRVNVRAHLYKSRHFSNGMDWHSSSNFRETHSLKRAHRIALAALSTGQTEDVEIQEIHRSGIMHKRKLARTWIVR